jgi:hypothetical protein
MTRPLSFGFPDLSPSSRLRTVRERLPAVSDIPTIASFANMARPAEARSHALRRGFSRARNDGKPRRAASNTITDQPPSPKSP